MCGRASAVPVPETHTCWHKTVIENDVVVDSMYPTLRHPHMLTQGDDGNDVVVDMEVPYQYPTPMYSGVLKPNDDYYNVDE